MIAWIVVLLALVIVQGAALSVLIGEFHAHLKFHIEAELERERSLALGVALRQADDA
jgi:hypothetical protein